MLGPEPETMAVRTIYSMESTCITRYSRLRRLLSNNLRPFLVLNPSDRISTYPHYWTVLESLPIVTLQRLLH
jgi:hypothetical protein